MCTINFRIDNRGKTDTKNVLVQIVHNGGQFKRSSGVKVNINNWDAKNGEPIDIFSNEHRQLHAIKNAFINNIYRNAKESVGEGVTVEQLAKYYDNYFLIEKLNSENDESNDFEMENDIEKLISSFINSKESIYSASRIHNYRTVLSLITSFTDEKSFKKDIEAINKTWILSFIDYLCYSKKYTNSSVESFLKCLRSVLNFYDKPIKFKLAEVTKGLRGGKIKNEIPFLTLKDLEVIKSCSDHRIFQMLHFRDLFLFCAYTGMRFNESQKITNDNIIEEDGITLLKYTTSKNGSTIEVPLNDWCVETFNKWGKELPKIPNDVANKGLHSLFEICGFNKPIKIVRYSGKNRVEEVKPLHDVLSFHDSRKSFGCNLIEGGLDLQSVSDLMGVDIATLMKWYSKSNKKDRNNKALQILNK